MCDESVVEIYLAWDVTNLISSELELESQNKLMKLRNRAVKSTVIQRHLIFFDKMVQSIFFNTFLKILNLLTASIVI